MSIRIGSTAVGLGLAVTRNGSRVTGGTVTVKIADPNVTNSFLDFSDNTFKTSSWTTKSLTLTEDTSETGVYKTVWDSSVAITTERRVTAIYEVTSPTGFPLIVEDLSFHDLATATNVSNTQTAIVAEIDANEAKIDIIDTIVDSILVDTGTTIPSQVTGIETSINTNVDAAETAILAAISALTIPTVGQIADGVWDEPIAGHLSAGTTGAILNAIDGDLTSIEGKIDTIDGIVDAILVDTDSTIPTAITAIETSINTNVDAAETAILAAISALSIPTSGIIAAAVWDEAMSGHESAGTSGLFMRKLLSAATGKVLYDEGTSVMAVSRYDDNNTVDFSFNIKDVDGNAAGTNPQYERVPV